MSGPLRVVGALFCWLLALTTSASAECAWILWAGVKDAAGVSYPERAAPAQSFLTKEFCERGRTAAEGVSSASAYWFFCLPDTIDPRGPKGTK